MSKYLDFEKQENNTYLVLTKKQKLIELGKIEFYQEWKKWVFSSIDYSVIYDAECLQDIIDFMKELNSSNNSKTVKEK